MDIKRPLLLFEIDEGISFSNLLCKYYNDAGELDAALNKIYNSLYELTPRYDVAVLIYPTHNYDRYGFGKEDPQPMDRVNHALKHTFQFFKDRGSAIKVYLEIYSSGIYTNQNGELRSLSPAPIHDVPEDSGRKGLSMDLDTVAALKAAYPEVFAGVRFHEIVGSDMSIRVSGNGHAFLLDEEVVQSNIETCRRTGLKLIWSDSCWLQKYPKAYDHSYSNWYQYEDTLKPYFLTPPVSTLIDYAEGELGENICFNWANNNYHMTMNLEFYDSKITGTDGNVTYPIPEWLFWDQPFSHFPLKDRKKARWGMSVQSWFWHELTSTLNHKYYLFGENNMPVEIMGTYVLKGLREGASVMQFEPPWYFFNMDIPYYSKPNTGNYEQYPDYSERLAFRRLKQILLNPEHPLNPPNHLDAFFDRDQKRFHENDIANPPLNYSQSTLGIGWKDTPKTYFDFYSDGCKWLEQNEYRYGELLFSGNIVDIQRIELQGDGVDELLVLKRNDEGKLEIEFYNQNSGFLQRDINIAADNEDGEFVALTTANLLSEGIRQGDPDEIIVIRRKAGEEILNLRVYKITEYSNNMQFTYSPLPYYENQTLKNKIADDSLLNAASFKGIIGFRTEAIQYSNNTRNVDKIAFVNSHTNGLHLSIKTDDRVTVSDIGNPTNLSGNVVLKAIDTDTDRKDEICIVRQDVKGDFIDLYRFSESNFMINTKADLAEVSTSVSNPFVLEENKALKRVGEAGSPNIEYLLALRKTILVNAPEYQVTTTGEI